MLFHQHDGPLTSLVMIVQKSQMDNQMNVVHATNSTFKL